MTPENKKTIMWSAGVVAGLVIVAAIVLMASGTGGAG